MVANRISTRSGDSSHPSGNFHFGLPPADSGKETVFTNDSNVSACLSTASIGPASLKNQA